MTLTCLVYLIGSGLSLLLVFISAYITTLYYPLDGKMVREEDEVVIDLETIFTSLLIFAIVTALSWFGVIILLGCCYSYAVDHDLIKPLRIVIKGKRK